MKKRQPGGAPLVAPPGFVQPVGSVPRHLMSPTPSRQPAEPVPLAVALAEWLRIRGFTVETTTTGDMMLVRATIATVDVGKVVPA